MSLSARKCCSSPSSRTPAHVCARARTPLGCDTFVAFPPTSPPNMVVFGKNSDRPQGESQSIRRYRGRSYEDGTALRCTYIEIPQARQTHSVLLSQIDWMWGAEHGTNDCGVVIGNEAVWTRVSDESLETKRLLGMDLVRLGLERGATAKQAMMEMVRLLETYGQGGPCAYQDHSFTYHNSFLVADRSEAWILETAGRQWVAQRVTEGARNISNTLTIRSDYDLCSKGLKEYARTHKLWNCTSATMPIDWALCFGDGAVEECESPYSRQSCGRSLMKKHGTGGTLDHLAMMKILRDHESGICMHGGFETAASMVSELKQDGVAADDRHWMMDAPQPCQNEYTIQDVVVVGNAT